MPLRRSRTAFHSFAAGIAVVVSLFVVAVPGHGQTPATPKASVTAPDSPDRWDAAIQAFEQQNAASPPAKGQKLLLNSSSSRIWNLAESFPDRPCLN
ncbi:MAG: hypothetical protein SH850_19390, partial [Planctomycetaceae bacterium]|nr:hypothetical protein [Planctomycetaceae bacterium]